MKYYIVVVLSIFFLVGCNKSKTTVEEVEMADLVYDAYIAIDESEVTKVEYRQEEHGFVYSVSLKEVQQDSEHIIIGKVLSIDGGSNYDYANKRYVFPYTYGIIKVIEPLKGSFEVDQRIPYAKDGAIITMEEYIKGSMSNYKKELNETFDPQKNYVQEYLPNDHKIEVGETYLIYFNNNKIDQYYSIVSGKEGMMKYQDGRVYDDVTNTWKKIEEVVK